jgi:aspartyl-tRNA(Asn)/glutamyl-tRNA(Gln) amidotransferase subunit A
MSELDALTIDEARRRLRARQLTATELTQAVLARIERTEPALHAFITPTPELALAQARAADERPRRRRRPALCGIRWHQRRHPDQGRAPGRPKVLESFVAPGDATVGSACATLAPSSSARRIATSLHGFVERNSPQPRTIPRTSRVPGGSSGGSSGGASRQALGALGTDTGG